MALQDTANQQKDVVIEIGFRIEDLRAKIGKQKTAIRKVVGEMNSELKGKQSQFAATNRRTQAQILEAQQLGHKKTAASYKRKLAQDRINQARELQQVRETYNKRIKTVSSGLGNQQRALESFNTHHRRARKQLALTSQRIKKAQVPFAGYAMSIMFAGMALTRISRQIATFGATTFKDIQHSVDNTSTGFDMLGGTMKYLGFQVGQALEPLAISLIPIVDRISELVSNNPALVRGFVKWGLIIGTVATVAGGLKLAIDGIVGTYRNLTLLVTGFKKLKTSIAGIKVTSALSNLFSKMRNFGNVILSGIVDSMKWISKNPVKGIMGAAVITGIITAFLWLNRLQKNMGGWDELLKNVGRGFLRLGAMFSAAITAVIQKAKDMWKAIWGDQTSGLSFTDFYGAKLEENLKKLNKDFDMTPSKGFIDNRSLSEIWKAELYPQIEGLNTAMSASPQKGAQINNYGTINIGSGDNPAVVMQKAIDEMV